MWRFQGYRNETLARDRLKLLLSSESLTLKDTVNKNQEVATGRFMKKCFKNSAILTGATCVGATFNKVANLQTCKFTCNWLQTATNVGKWLLLKTAQSKKRKMWKTNWQLEELMFET